MKKILIIVSTIIIAIILIIGYCSKLIKESNIEDNLMANSVYYAKNMPHAKDKHPVLIMLIDNLEYIKKPEINGFKYKPKVFDIISYKYSENKIIYLVGSKDENGQKEYSYTNKQNIDFIFDKNFKLKAAKVFREKKEIDISTVDEQTLIDEIYEFVKPIVDFQTEPEVNMQEEFNKRYKERFN